MKSSLFLFFSLFFCVNIAAQSGGYFQFRGRVSYKNKEIKGASIKVYSNNSLVKNISSLAQGKFTIDFDLNRYFIVKIQKDNKSRSIIVNTNVPKTEKNKAFDSYKIIKLIENNNNDLYKLIFSYNPNSKKFVIHDAPKNMQVYQSSGKEPTVSELKKEIAYLTKLLENNRKIAKSSQNATYQKGNNDSKSGSNVLQIIKKDTSNLSQIIENDNKQSVTKEELEKYEIDEDSFNNDPEISELKKQIEELDKQDNPLKAIEKKRKKLAIRKKMIELAREKIISKQLIVESDSAKKILKERETELFLLGQTLTSKENELDLAKQTIEHKNLQIQNRNIILILLVLAFILIVSIAIILFTNYKKKKQLNAKLEYQNQELKKLSVVASETTNAIMITDNKGNFNWVNKGYNKLFGYEENEPHKNDKQNIFESGYDEQIYNKLKETIKTGKPTTYQTSTKSKTGKLIWIQASVTPILNLVGKVSKLVIIYSDITQTKEAQNKILKQNKQIMASINYAKKIQDAILPSKTLFKSHFPNSFIYFQPRDVVSGDFYWMSVQNEKLFVAAVDCTGHGVPGAFMSLIGNTLLNNIVNERKIYNPAEILKELNRGVIKSLNQSSDSEEEGSTDGMDLSICRFDKSKEELQIALSNHKAFIINEKQDIQEINGDNISIGETSFNLKQSEFTTHKVHFKQGYTIYLFSDGYHDQLGGERYRKFLTKNFKKLLQEYNKGNMASLPDKLNKNLMNWKGNNKQTDDILIMGIRF